MPQEIVILDSFMGDPREIQHRLSLKKTDKPDIKTRNKLLAPHGERQMGGYSE